MDKGKKFRVLAADDEIELLDSLELFFEKENIELIKAKDGLEALNLFKEYKIHLLLLDIMMPEVNGFEVLKRVRKESKVPAIMVTARTQDYDKILGLELGADDYVTKPYNPMEVVARVKAQLRRNYDYGTENVSVSNDIVRFNLTLKSDEGILLKDEKEISVTKTEFMILELLMKNPGKIFTKQQIFNYAWDDPYASDDNTIMVHISNLRSKIEDNPKKPGMLKTIKGLGYKFEKE